MPGGGGGGGGEQDEEAEEEEDLKSAHSNVLGVKAAGVCSRPFISI
jgi:hypothetical protein